MHGWKRGMWKHGGFNGGKHKYTDWSDGNLRNRKWFTDERVTTDNNQLLISSYMLHGNFNCFKVWLSLLNAIIVLYLEQYFWSEWTFPGQKVKITYWWKSRNSSGFRLFFCFSWISQRFLLPCPTCFFMQVQPEEIWGLVLITDQLLMSFKVTGSGIWFVLFWVLLCCQKFDNIYIYIYK